MFGLNEFQLTGTTPVIPSPAPREPRVALCYDRQCAWCLRLKHRDGKPHGQPWPRFSFYSHGICSSCKAKLQPQEARFGTRPAVSDLGSRFADRAA